MSLALLDGPFQMGWGLVASEGMCVCVYSWTLPSALCVNVGLKSPLHCAGSFPREKAIDSVSSEWIEADSKRGFGMGRKQATPGLHPLRPNLAQAHAPLPKFPVLVWFSAAFCKELRFLLACVHICHRGCVQACLSARDGLPPTESCHPPAPSRLGGSTSDPE